MSINQQLISEIRTESTRTRKMLERIPLDKADWKPHEKSTTIGRLATHLAEVPIWGSRILEHDEFDFLAHAFTPKVAANTAELLQIHDDNTAKMIAAVEASTEESLKKKWILRRGEHIVYEQPKEVMLRNFAFNHQYHHRGQLSVYLRLLDIPVPGVYGPSADER